MNLLSLFHFTVFLVNLWLIFFILSRNPKALPNWICALLICCFAVWNFTFTFFHASATYDRAIFWLNISSIGWCSIAAFALWLSVVLTKRSKILSKWYFYFLIILIPVFLIYKQWTGSLIDNLVRQPYGWAVVWSESVWPWIFYAFYSSVPMAVLYFGYNAAKERRFLFEKKRIKLTVSSGFLFFITASVTEVILPRLHIYSIPSIGSIMTIFLAIAIIYGITKYRFMTLTPSYAASDIISTMSDSLFLIDPEGKVIEANNSALNLLNYTRKEMIGGPVSVIFPGEIIQFLDNKDDLHLKKNSIERHHIFLRTKTGEDIPVSFSIALMKDKEENLLGIVCVAKDMREILLLQKREKELAVEKARSEALMERSQELQDAYDKLRNAQHRLIQSEKMAAVGQLAGGVAHEINNPMGVILGFAQGIISRIHDDDPLYMPLKSIEREAVRCRKLVGDLMTFSRAERTHAEKTDINQTIDETVSFIEARAKVQNIGIEKEFGKIPLIMVNKNQVQQVVVNLFNNSADAMPGGGKIKLATKDIGEYICIEVSDNGKGMTEEIKKHLFEPFFTTKEVGKGTGLGLSICYEIVQKHKGTIEVESEPGKGTIFTIKLPVS